MQHSGGNGSAVGGESRRRLAATLVTVLSEAVYDHAALQDDVCGFVRELKRSGVTAQGVVIAARNLLRETAGQLASSHRTDELLSKMLGWCLDEYYRESA